MNLQLHVIHIFFIFEFVVAQMSKSLKQPQVKIANGTVVGQRYKISNKGGVEFLGIPFARPPTGDLRFARPQPINEAWTEPLHATSPGNRCLQLQKNGYIDKNLPPNIVRPSFDEDCLFLNIWSPDNATSKPRAVMIWIHGGSFLVGESYPYFNGRALAVMGDVVVVTIQYRLNVFGFLRLGDSVAGNWGLWDQQMALRWVSENIEHFGGDPYRITLFGNSAGGASVSIQLLNAESVRYFKRAIVQSGSANAIWAVLDDKEALEKDHQKFASEVRCRTNDVDETKILSCLRKMDAKEMLDATSKNIDQNGFFLRWVPVVDGIFIKESPNKTYTNGLMAKKQLILGYNKDEAAILITTRYAAPEHLKGTNAPNLFVTPALDKYIDFFFHYYPQFPRLSTDKFVQAIKKKFGNSIGQNATKNHIILNEVMSILFFDCSIEEMARAYKKIGSQVYMYKFAFRPIASWTPAFFNATHGDENRFIFAQHLVYPNVFKFSHQEKRMSLFMIRLWTSFAKNGVPIGSIKRVMKPLSKRRYKCSIDM